MLWPVARERVVITFDSSAVHGWVSKRASTACCCVSMKSLCEVMVFSSNEKSFQCSDIWLKRLTILLALETEFQAKHMSTGIKPNAVAVCSASTHSRTEASGGLKRNSYV